MDALLNISPSTEPTNNHQLTPKSPDLVSESANRLLSRRPPQPMEQLPCPRCDSTNTKFCYYNNYNLSQPRHLCKSCRRYWTRGGALRKVPVGGGTRRPSSISNKRNRITTPTTTATKNNTTDSDPLLSSSVPGTGSAPLSLNEDDMAKSGSFNCWWNSGGWVLPFNGYGHEILDSEVVESPGCNTWQIGGGADCGVAEDDYFSWPDLGVSAPAKALK